MASKLNKKACQLTLPRKRIAAGLIASVGSPATELVKYRLLEPDEALALLNRRLRRGVTHSLAALAAGKVIHLEQEEPVWTTGQE